MWKEVGANRVQEIKQSANRSVTGGGKQRVLLCLRLGVKEKVAGTVEVRFASLNVGHEKPGIGWNDSKVKIVLIAQKQNMASNARVPLETQNS